ncbi:hypothetical protein ACRAWF_24720 [Streptomyces sp. L7]
MIRQGTHGVRVVTMAKSAAARPQTYRITNPQLARGYTGECDSATNRPSRSSRRSAGRRRVIADQTR